MTIRIAQRYAEHVPQLVTRLDQALLDAIDGLVAEGVADSRSEVVRTAVQQFADRHRRAAIGRRIAEEYAGRPQTDAEIAWSDAATVAMIAEEPW